MHIFSDDVRARSFCGNELDKHGWTLTTFLAINQWDAVTVCGPCLRVLRTNEPPKPTIDQ